ncbi:MAG: hypothetical protein LBN95_07790 [Prevotellaceae bacterium]|jgi:hypothetical protein|nr:hypothetical protein [Prevotellaceae bacterium]
MIKSVLKYVSVAFLLMIYINRGLFVSPDEMGSNPHEINSIIELLAELITGQSNNTDEDGDTQETCNSVKMVQPFIVQQFSQSLELLNKIPQKTEKISFPINENLPKSLVLGQIDHPPKC